MNNTKKSRLSNILILIIASLALLILGGLLYRNNAVSTQRQVTTIITADKAGKPIDKQLTRLTGYVKTHMNATTSFALQGSYLRDYSAAQAAALQQTQAGAKVYSDAQANCSARVDSIQLSNCVTNYIAANATPNQAPTTITLDKNKYIRTLTAPKWSWDLSGILITLGLAGLIAWLVTGVVSLGVHKPRKRHRT